MFNDYQEYLLSDLWRSRRSQAIRDAGYHCEQCGSMVRLQIHHLDYRRLGNENKEDLVVLCEKCHKNRHERVKCEQ